MDRFKKITLTRSRIDLVVISGFHRCHGLRFGARFWNSRIETASFDALVGRQGLRSVWEHVPESLVWWVPQAFTDAPQEPRVGAPKQAPKSDQW